ncbi:unnamed protein product [Pleuronectes platessa]|uniref:Uncharacterized protein n=1 Tax=Pleuronectes platessa TaxID=8262 RepID=A0A9N7YGJ6_PLEPL|nr:unnamed protein product [Pleuronectes platessa]
MKWTSTQEQQERRGCPCASLRGRAPRGLRRHPIGRDVALVDVTQRGIPKVPKFSGREKRRNNPNKEETTRRETKGEAAPTIISDPSRCSRTDERQNITEPDLQLCCAEASLQAAMSDHSSSTGSSSSSTNSWTLLSPEDAAVENVGPVDDGTESLGDVASLSEELAGAAVEFRPIDILVETVLSEEGHQVCQETSPESSEGPIPSSPVQMSPLPHDPLDPLPDLDMESQAPVIHEIDTSSPCKQDLVSPAEESPDFDVEPEVNVATEIITAINPPSHVHADVSFAPVSTELPSPAPESLVPEEPVDESPAPETVGSVEAEEPVDESPAPETVGSVEAEEPVDESPAPETVGSVEAEEEAAVEEEATETWETGEQEGEKKRKKMSHPLVLATQAASMMA